jgi:hypothetical protein
MVFNATFNIISVISWRLNNLDIKISIEIIDVLFKYSMMIQLYCGGQFWRKPDYQEKTTLISQVIGDITY